jgi:L-ascorbate metabolism protein UlaG (beta-lactamase superfamily)
MNISWLGHACFRIAEKIDSEEVVVVTAPFGKEVGLFPPKIKADIILINKQDPEYNFLEKVQGNIDENPLIIERPGEYERKKVFVTGIDSFVTTKKGEKVRSIVYKIVMDRVSVAHLGGLAGPLSEEEIELLGDVDVLLLPVGGNGRLDAAMAGEIVRQIEPRIVVPMEYAISGVTMTLDTEQKFVKEMGLKAESMPKLKLARKDLPEDAMHLYLLEKE